MTNNKKLDELMKEKQDLAFKLAEEECFAWAVYDKMSNQEKDEAIESYEKLYFEGLKFGYIAAQKEAEILVNGLTYYSNELNIEPHYKEVLIPGTKNTRPSLNMKYFEKARSILETYNKGRE